MASSSGHFLAAQRSPLPPSPPPAGPLWKVSSISTCSFHKHARTHTVPGRTELAEGHSAGWGRLGQTQGKGPGGCGLRVNMDSDCENPKASQESQRGLYLALPLDCLMRGPPTPVHSHTQAKVHRGTPIIHKVGQCSQSQGSTLTKYFVCSTRPLPYSALCTLCIHKILSSP